MHADRTNRAMLTLVGLLALLVGLGALLLGLGVFGKDREQQHLFDNAVSRWVGSNGQWAWPVAAAVCLVLLLLCLRWLLVILTSTDRVNVLEIPAEKRRGRTRLESNALSSAVAREMESYRGVERAKARLVGSARAPRLVLTVTSNRDADLAALRDRIESEAIAHSRQALDNPSLPVRLDLRVGGKSRDRV